MFIFGEDVFIINTTGCQNKKLKVLAMSPCNLSAIAGFFDLGYSKCFFRKNRFVVRKRERLSIKLIKHLNYI